MTAMHTQPKPAPQAEPIDMFIPREAWASTDLDILLPGWRVGVRALVRALARADQDAARTDEPGEGAA